MSLIKKQNHKSLSALGIRIGLVHSMRNQKIYKKEFRKYRKKQNWQLNWDKKSTVEKE